MKWLPLVGYVLTIVAANVTLAYVGLIPVTPWGLMAPAGVLWAGLALTLRDLVHDALGARWAVAAIVVGAALSWFVSPSFAAASGIAFLVSEFSDMVVYTPLRERHWLTAVALSNTVGLVIDSAAFLWLAFGSLDFMLGQVVGKVEMTVLAVIVLWLLRSRRQAPAAVMA